MTPEQPLIQFLSILPESEYEVEKKAIAMGETSTATRSSSRSGHVTRICNFSRVRVEGERTWGTLSWQMEEGSRAGSVIRHQAPVVVTKGEGARVGAIERPKKKTRIPVRSPMGGNLIPQRAPVISASAAE